MKDPLWIELGWESKFQNPRSSRNSSRILKQFVGAAVRHLPFRHKNYLTIVSVLFNEMKRLLGRKTESHAKNTFFICVHGAVLAPCNIFLTTTHLAK